MGRLECALTVGPVPIVSMSSSLYLRFKIVSSFAIAVLFAVALVRLASSAPHEATAAFAVGICAVAIVAAAWRGWIYLRAARRQMTPR